MPHSLQNTSSNKESLADLAASLLRIEGEKIDVVPNADAGKTEVISDRDLEMLLDRRPEVFQERTKGWTSAGADDMVEDEKPKTAAFEVFDLSAGAVNDPLALLTDEDGVYEVEEVTDGETPFVDA